MQSKRHLSKESKELRCKLSSMKPQAAQIIFLQRETQSWFEEF